MKVLWIMGLGIGIWSLSLFWPGINKLPLWPIGVGIILIIGASLLTYLLSHRIGPRPNNNHHNHPSRPIPVTVRI